MMSKCDADASALQVSPQWSQMKARKAGNRRLNFLPTKSPLRYPHAVRSDARLLPGDRGCHSAAFCGEI